MSRSNNYVFVLWGNEFEEMMAAIFITELRRVGLQVKVVGLTRRQASGVYGLALAPDITLEQALPLAGDTTCLVIPCTASGGKRLKNDPRLDEFFRQAHTNKAKFVLGQLNAEDLNLFPPAIDSITVLPGNEALIALARTVAHSLLNVM